MDNIILYGTKIIFDFFGGIILITLGGHFEFFGVDLNFMRFLLYRGQTVPITISSSECLFTKTKSVITPLFVLLTHKNIRKLEIRTIILLTL